MRGSWLGRTARGVAGVLAISLSGAGVTAQEADATAVIQRVDAAVAARVEHVAGFTDIEHYSVYRGDDETHPVAQMTVRDTYRKGLGKTYTILSQSGSGIALKFGLKPLLDNEKEINLPGKVDKSWFTSANYEMKERSGAVEKMNGHDCRVLDITPKEKAPNLVEGRLWVDARNGSIVEIDGVASKKPSIYAGTTHMMRQYADIDGYPMATHARAESDSFLFGRTVVVIDYSDYKLQLATGK